MPSSEESNFYFLSPDTAAENLTSPIFILQIFYHYITKSKFCQVLIAKKLLEESEELNIKGATYLAMQRALEQLDPAPALALIDGNDTNTLPVPSVRIVKGDSLCASIAAASILAKVTRDRFMEAYALQYPGYGFEVHKGYPTRRHYDAIFELGLTPLHRRSFLTNLDQKRRNG